MAVVEIKIHDPYKEYFRHLIIPTCSDTDAMLLSMIGKQIAERLPVLKRSAIGGSRAKFYAERLLVDPKGNIIAVGLRGETLVKALGKFL